MCSCCFVILPCCIQEYADKRGFVWTNEVSDSGDDSDNSSSSGSGRSSDSENDSNSDSDSDFDSGSGSADKHLKRGVRESDDDNDSGAVRLAKKARQDLDDAQNRCSYGSLCKCPKNAPGAVCPCGAPTHHLCYLKGKHFRDVHEGRVEDGKDGGGATVAACPAHCLVVGCKSCFAPHRVEEWESEGRRLSRPSHFIPALLSLQSEMRRESEQERTKLISRFGNNFMNRSALDFFLDPESHDQVLGAYEVGKVSAPTQTEFSCVFNYRCFLETNVVQQRIEQPGAGRTVGHGADICKNKDRCSHNYVYIQNVPLQDR